MSFNPKEISTFYFEEVVYDEQTSEARLLYSLDKKYKFEEVYTFKGAKPLKSPEHRLALNSALAHLHLMCGVSYFKTAVPLKIVSENYKLSAATAALFNELYTEGLSEFAYVNNLDLNGRINFPCSATEPASASDIPLGRLSVVPVGGGKDSVVTLETLKKSMEPLAAFVMGSNATILKVAGIPGIPVINVSRKICPKLIEINKEGAYNGHVPISAILSFLLVASSILYDFDTAVMSYEHSANSPTLNKDGKNVNHQYSKSFACERLIHDYIKSSLLTNFTYFSFIRPLSELAVSAAFSRLTDYHASFTSCNAHFKISAGSQAALWCNNCPKCRFVFLALAPFLDKFSLIRIFGKNLLDFPDQLNGFQELLGISGHKPFECVGEIDECRFALRMLSKMPAWNNDYIVKTLSGSIPVQNNKDFLTFFSKEHLLPARYEEILSANFRS